jgi:hypothetical protein
MCLRIITKAPRIKYGYKVFLRNDNGSLTGEFKNTSKERVVGKWLNEKDFRPNVCDIITTRTFCYKAGWHVYDNLDDLILFTSKRFEVWKVQVFMVTAHGDQIFKKGVTVCRYIKLLERIN